LLQSSANRQAPGLLDLADLPDGILRQLSGRIQDNSLPSKMTASVEDAPHHLQGGDLNELTQRILDEQGWNLRRTFSELERLVFAAALLRSRGNQTQAARLLGVTSRSVYNKVQKHHLLS